MKTCKTILKLLFISTIVISTLVACEKTAIEEEYNIILSLSQEDGDRGGGGGGAQAN